MPKKTKEQTELETKNKVQKKETTSKKNTNKKEAIAKSPSKKTTHKKEIITKTTSQKPNEEYLATTTKIKKESKKKAIARKTTNKRTSTQKNTSKKSTSSKKKVEIVEYYDLPYRYNQTIVKVLAQTPTNLFIYWDISDKDRKNFEKQYGEDFFKTTRPILIIHNDTLNYHFEVEINDFANSWYLHIADSKCDYRIELGRRPITKTKTLNTNYIYIATSNEIEAPNDRILLNHNQQMVYFRNTKTGQQTEKTISSISFIRNMGKIYNIYDFYQTIYQEEKIFDLSNPSSATLPKF